VEQGIIAGGGAALVHAASSLDGLKLPDDEATGVSVVREALSEPLRWIANNAGLEGYVVVNRVAQLGENEGLDAATGEYVDMLKHGIVDPVKVTKAALGNAASVASMVLSTESAIVDKPAEPEPDHGHGHSHGGHGHSH
jgi:chaperonin GroEL